MGEEEAKSSPSQADIRSKCEFHALFELCNPHNHETNFI